MAKVYSKAPSGVAERLAHIMKCFHAELHNAGAKVDLLSVADDDPECEHALKLRGHPAYAIVRILDIKQRTKGHGDAEIVIDEAKWLSLPDATKDSILDHELEHLDVQISTKTKRVKLDCAGRPKLKMRLHDVEYGHFVSIAERHGAASIEVQQCRQLLLTHRQTLFPFLEAMPALDIGKKLIERAARGEGMEGFEKMAKEDDTTVTLRAGGKSVTIDKDGVHPSEKACVMTSDGRQITPTQMKDEIKQTFEDAP